MKTNTRSQILKIIQEKGETRPTDLAEKLKITPQALHRHLKALVENGTLERRGGAPFTQYAQAGRPDFTSAFQWLKAKKVTENPESVCETRDIFAGRLSRFQSFVKQGLPAQDLSLVVSVAGEIGNNSFDHNLGRWIDVPGCWMESQKSGGMLWVCIADRGQGIYQSLSRVDPSLKNDQEAIEAAFEKKISGRAPEQRGNGLKFVKSIVTQNQSRGLCCHSGNGCVVYGAVGENCKTILEKISQKTNGTITVIAWELK